MATTLEQTKRQAERVTGISNIAYDLMVVLTNKLQGVAAIEGYKQDANVASDQQAADFLMRIEERELQEIGELRELVMQRLQLAHQA